MVKDTSKVKTIPEFIARNQLGRILERVKGNKERIVVSRKGEATAVILGYEDFLRSVLRLKETAMLRRSGKPLDAQALRDLLPLRSTRRFGLLGRIKEKNRFPDLLCSR